VASSLIAFRYGGVGFIDWLDFGAVLANAVIIKVTLAVDDLSAATRASLNVTAKDVKLAFAHAAIVAWLAICSPALALIAVAYARKTLAADGEARLNGVVRHKTMNLTRIRTNFWA